MLPKWLREDLGAKFYEAWRKAVEAPGEDAHPRVKALHEQFTDQAMIAGQSFQLIHDMIDEIEKSQGVSSLEALAVVHSMICGPAPRQA